MLMSKKLIALFAVLLLTFTVLGGCNNSETVIPEDEIPEDVMTLADGTYVGKSSGHNGEITVEVTIEEGNILDVEVLEHNETRILTDPAFDRIISAVVEGNTTNVDVVSGATITSYGIINSIKDALKSAGASDEFFNSGDKIAFDYKVDQLDETYDVIVIGSGGAGLSAAIEAKSRGASVVVLEKMNSAGGNTLVSGGGLNVPNTSQQEVAGVDDSVDLFIEDTLKGGDLINNEVLVETMAKNALAASQWLVEDVGVQFMPDRLQQFGGHSVPRALISQGNKGVELIERLKATAEELGVEFKFGTRAEELIIDSNGEVVGVNALNNAGQELTFHSEKGVIIATGGFGASLDMRLQYNQELDNRYNTTVMPSTTGDGILMAEKANANLIDMEYIQTYPTCNPRTGVISYVANSRFDGAILVNQEGHRFINEMGRRDEISKSILAQTGAQAYLLWGQEIESVGNMTSLHKVEYDNLEKYGFIHSADTIEEVAAFFEVDLIELKNTLDAYNDFVDGEKELDLSRGGTLRPIREGKFYIQKVVPAVHHTMGGIEIDEKARVIDVNGNPIQGLFAAGEVTGGIHGTNRLGGNAITDIIVFGRIAGENVVK